MLFAHGLIVAILAAAVLCRTLWLRDVDGQASVSRTLRLWWRRWLLCLYRGRHEPVRVPFGWRCATCTRALADLGEAHLGEGYVASTRRLFSRANGGEITRTEDFEPTRRGF